MIPANPEPFFNRGPSPFARLTFFCLAAIVIMIADRQFHALDSLRSGLSLALHPIERMIAMPGQIVARVSGYFSVQDRLLNENRELQTRVLELSALSQQAKLLKTEHERLTRLARSASRFEDRGVIAEVIRDSRNPFSRKVIIDKGRSHGLSPGLAVIDGNGVVGQISAAGTFTSEVTLLTEKDQAVPVMIVRNGLRAVAVGTGKDAMVELPFIPVGADVRKDDVLVTSGIDGTYPAGLEIAIVSQVEKNTAAGFARITAQPSSGPDSHRYILVLHPSEAQIYPQPDFGSEQKKSRREKNPGKR